MTLSRSADALRLEQPLKINGQAGLSGDLAKILSLSAKNFEAVARPGIDAQVDLSDRWCPVVNATPTMNWVSHAAVEMIGKNCLGVDLPGFGRQEVCAGPVNVDLTQYVNDAIGKTRDDIKTAIQSALPCDLVKKPVSEQWRTVAIPIEPMPGERLFVNITPKSAAFSGLQVEERAVRVAIRLGARTQVSDTAIAPQSLPLPPLERITAGSSSLALSVQAQVRYDRLARVLGGTLAGSVFEEQTPAGAVRVRIDEASIYPSQTSLVIGLKVDAKIPGQAFDTSGWVYLYGQPVADSNGRALSIESLRYATVLDNRFWSATSALFNGKILAFLRSHSKVDLADLLRDTASAVSKSLNEARLDGLVLKTDVPQISLRSVALGPQGVVAVVGLAMPFELQVDVAALAGRLP